METKELFEQLQNKLIINLEDDEIVCPHCKGLRMILKLDGEHGYIEQCRKCQTGKLYVCKHCGESSSTGYCNCGGVAEIKRVEQKRKELEAMDKAKIINFKDYDGCLFEPNGGEHVLSKDGFQDAYLDDFDVETSPKRVYATSKSQVVDVNIYETILEHCEDGYEDMYSYLDTNSELLTQAQILIETWQGENREQLQTYYEDNSIVVDLTELYEEGLKNGNV